MWPPPTVRAAIADAAARLLPRRCRAVPSTNYHLTVRFLGGVANERLPALCRLVEDLELEPFTLALAETGAFSQARVAWLAPRRTPAALSGLHAAAGAALHDAGFGFDTREFRPHVTLARQCRTAPAPWQDPPLAWRVDHAVLCRSDGTDAGVRYTVIARTASASVR